MENRNSYQKDLFTNRLKKKYRELRRWARKNGTGPYRLYDRDIPEIPLSVDVYDFLPENVRDRKTAEIFISEQNARFSANDPDVEKEAEERRWAVMHLYERPYEKDESKEEEWLSLMAEAVSSVLNIEASHIIKKTRKMQKGLSQYEKNEGGKNAVGTVAEQGGIFKVDLSSYLDTGLFFDHRPTRLMVREESNGKRVLNLFCYTGSFSVYAAAGGASYVESVDLSNTYISWAKENLSMNGFRDAKKYVFTKADATDWLSKKAANIRSNEEGRFDIIILDPPTFSNSKSTQNVLDINRDWPVLVENCVKILNPNGTLYFSTNSTRLAFDEKKLPKNTECTDITKASIPKDFEGTKCHRCWKIRLY